ncbi:hypothetical protein [Pseudomonas sp. S36]
MPKRYQNPHTGEFIETASANHKLLKNGNPTMAPTR